MPLDPSSHQLPRRSRPTKFAICDQPDTWRKTFLKLNGWDVWGTCWAVFHIYKLKDFHHQKDYKPPMILCCFQVVLVLLMLNLDALVT